MPSSDPHPEIYTADNGEFGWRIQDGNNQIVATGHETYTRDADAERALRNVATAFAGIRRRLSNSWYVVPRVDA